MKIKLAVILISLCFLMCGCSAASVENLLTPPKLTAEQNEIYNVLINSVGQNVKLKYPRSGDYRSAFVFQDIDDESDLEAMVFYERSSGQQGERTLRLKFLDKRNGSWESMYDLSIDGSEIDSISFAKLGNAEITEIVICYTVLNQTEKQFSVVKVDGGTPVELYKQSYACLEVFDLNGDGQDELLSVNVDRVNHVSSAAMFTDSEEGFVKLSEVALSDSVTDYLRVTKGMVYENRAALFLDYSKGSGQSGTDVLYCYGNRLCVPDNSVSASNVPIISRMVNDLMSEIYCYDIDGDGLVEIPSTTPLPGYEVLTKPEQLCAVTWHTVENDKLVLEHYSYFSSRYRFALLFPNRWRGVVSARTNFADNEIVFISYNEETGLSGGSELMRIRSVDKDDAEAVAAAKEYAVLGESSETLYYLIESKKFSDDLMKLTESELKKSFIVL